MSHKKISDLQEQAQKMTSLVERVKGPLELVIHFNTFDTGRLSPNQRQSDHDLKILKNDLEKLKDAAKELSDIYKDLLH